MPKPTKDLTNQAHTGARYIGDGAYLEGVPARDMTSTEWDALDKDARALLLKARIFVLANQTVQGTGGSDTKEQ